MASKDAPLRAALEEAWRARNTGTPTLNDLWSFDLPPIGREEFAKAAAACEEVWRKPVPPAGAKPGAGVNFAEYSKLLKERFNQFNAYLASTVENPLDFFKILKWVAEPARAKPGKSSPWGNVWKELYLLTVAHGRVKALYKWNNLPTVDATVPLKALAEKKRLFDPTATFVAGSNEWGFHPKDAELIYLPFIDPARERRGNGANPDLLLLRSRILMHHRDVQRFQDAQQLRRTATVYTMFRGGFTLLSEMELEVLSAEMKETDPVDALTRTWQEADRHYYIDEGEQKLFSVIWIDEGSRYAHGRPPCVYIELNAFPGHVFKTYGHGQLPALARDQMFKLVAESLTALGEFLITYFSILGLVVDVITAGGASVTLRGLVYAFFREKLIEAAVDMGLDAAKVNSMALRFLVHAVVGMKTGTAGRKLKSADEIDAERLRVIYGRPNSARPSTPPRTFSGRGSGATDHFSIYDPDASRVVTAELRAKISNAAKLQYAEEDAIIDELAGSLSDRMVRAQAGLEQLLEARSTVAASHGTGTSMYRLPGVSSAKGLGKSGPLAGAPGTAATKRAARFANSEAYRALENYRDWVPPREWEKLAAERDQIRKKLLTTSPKKYPMKQANKDLKTILNDARELHGEEHALIDVFSQFEVDDYLAIPVRGKSGPPMLDVGVRLKRGQPYSFVLVEAKGGRNTPLGEVTLKEYFYDAAGKLDYSDVPGGGIVKQATGEWYYQKFAEIYRAGQKANDKRIMSLALDLMDAARNGKVHFRVMKSGVGSVKDIDDTAAVTAWFQQKLAYPKRGQLPIPHSVRK